MFARKGFLFVVAVVLISCEGGLEPLPPVEPGFSGTIRFAPNSWPPVDSLVNLWVFASQIYPLDSTKVFPGLFGQPQTIFYYPTDSARIAFNVDSVSYSFPVPPATYRYIGVVQRFRNDLNIRSFRVVGFYYSPSKPDQPRFITILDGEQVAGIDMSVDFYNPPVQPF